MYCSVCGDWMNYLDNNNKILFCRNCKSQIDTTDFPKKFYDKTLSCFRIHEEVVIKTAKELGITKIKPKEIQEVMSKFKELFTYYIDGIWEEYLENAIKFINK